MEIGVDYLVLGSGIFSDRVAAETIGFEGRVAVQAVHVCLLWCREVNGAFTRGEVVQLWKQWSTGMLNSK